MLTRLPSLGAALLELRSIAKTYDGIPVLRDVSLAIHAGEYAAIIGPSGAGKTTLLGILGLLEPLTAGEYRILGKSVVGMTDQQLSRLRNELFGFVFQQFSLLPHLPAWQNVARPLLYARVPKGEQKERALALLRKMGLESRVHHRPAELSGGEQQRVAIARALINDPRVVLADEPTGQLPREQWEPVLETLGILNAEGKTILLVTHNAEVAAHAAKRFVLHDGSLSQALQAATTKQPTARTVSPCEDPVLELRFLGHPTATLHGVPLALTQRQMDLLAILASHPHGLRGEALLLEVYGDEGKLSTLKSALSKLRRLVPIGMQPYRIGIPFQSDFQQLELHLAEGHVREAASLYRGPLLKESTSPGVTRLRQHLEEALRTSVLACNDVEMVYELAVKFEDDLELWECAIALLAPDDPRHALARARIAQLQRSWA
jgi:putative ABC transport system ATP-binding protein